MTLVSVVPPLYITRLIYSMSSHCGELISEFAK